MQDFKGLRVWRHSRILVREVYHLTHRFPPSERFGLIAQLRRSAVSINANIAEGCGRGSRSELLRFLYIAEGSAYELETESILSGDLGFLAQEDFGRLEGSIVAIKRMLGALIRRIRSDGASTASTANGLPMTANPVRLDKWLWAARFYKTRAAASEAIDGGKVDVNDVRAKRAKLLHVGDRIRVRRSPFEFVLTVRVLSEHRGSAALAQALYEEDARGKAARERLAGQLRVAPPPAYEGKGRPTKRDRREMERLRGADD